LPEFPAMYSLFRRSFAAEWRNPSRVMRHSWTVGRDSVEPKLDFVGKSHSSMVSPHLQTLPLTHYLAQPSSRVPSQCGHAGYRDLFDVAIRKGNHENL
jgi:hypothetical protein